MKKCLWLFLSAWLAACSADGSENSLPGNENQDPSGHPDAPRESAYWTDPAVSAGLQVRGGEEPAFWLGDEKFYETGVNCYDLFLASISRNDDASWSFDTSLTQDMMRILKRNEVGVIRFSGCVYYAQDIPAYVENRQRYLATLARIANLAEQYRIGLIPSIIWQYRAIPDYCGEGTAAWGRADSRTIAFMKEYVRDVVTTLSRFKSIYAWEFGNELNLDADLPNWQEAFNTTDPDYHFTHADLNFAFRTFIEVVQENDPAGRAIISGHANLRNSQYHQYAFNSWETDSRDDYRTITGIVTPDGMQCSEHIYELTRPFAGMGTVGLEERLRIAKETAASLGKTYAVGEFGASSDDGYETYYDALLRAGVQLSLVWNFSLLGNIEHSFTADSDRGVLLFDHIRRYNARFREIYGGR